MKKWNIVHDADAEDNTPTLWSTEINNSKYGRFVWIEINSSGTYDIVVDDDNILKTCKSLTSAKKWVARNL